MVSLFGWGGGGRELVCVLFACKCLNILYLRGRGIGWSPCLVGAGGGAENWSVCCLHVNVSTYCTLGAGELDGLPVWLGRGGGGGRELVCVLFACKCPLGAGELDGLPVWLGRGGAENWSVCCLHVNVP